MKQARMLAMISLIAWSQMAYANEHANQQAKEQAKEHSPEEAAEQVSEPVVEHHTERAEVTEATNESNPVVAMSEKGAKAIRAEAIYSVGTEPEVLVGKHNTRYELSPHAVAQFSQDGMFSLLRGSAIVENRSEASMKTNSAKIDFVGRVVVSYDYKEKSTSVFVLVGEARLINPAQVDRTLRLDRFRGASMVTGEVYPQLIRELDFASVDSWLQGYAWPKERLKEVLKELPQEKMKVAEAVPEHLQQAKLEDYFSSIDNADEAAPDYYERKFSDPDTQILQANSKKEKKEITPEVAAMIALPTNKIDLELDLPPQIISEKEKRAELRNAKYLESGKKGRGIASISQGESEARKKSAALKKADNEPQMHRDPEINAVLERLKSVRSDDAVVINGARQSSRAPASINARESSISPSVSPGIVPDPVYDYSENF